MGFRLAGRDEGLAEPAGKPDRTPIRLMLHATDPDKLEQRIGRPASEGCIRVPTMMNRFLDRHGVIDAEYERAAATDIRFRACCCPTVSRRRCAGDTLIVIDSAEKPPQAASRGPGRPTVTARQVGAWALLRTPPEYGPPLDG